jgi:uncharacterized protein YcfJ
MKKIYLSLIFAASTGYCQLGFEPYTGQPTSTIYGSAIGAGTGYMLAPAISNGCDAQWIGALLGALGGGLVGNYMAGDNIQHQKLMNAQQQQSTYTPRRAANVQEAIRINKTTFQSPHSEFTVSTADYKPGSVVNDPLTGELFRIPR